DASQHPSHSTDTGQPATLLPTSQKAGTLSQEAQYIHEHEEVLFSTTPSQQAAEEAEDPDSMSDALSEEDGSDSVTSAQQSDTDLLSDDLFLSDQDLSSIVTADLWQGGILSQRLPGYEERPAQVEMASLVSQAITQHVPAVVEAATGTGKSLSY